MKRYVCGLVATLCLVSVMPAYAWAEFGHELVCEIAWQKLTPSVKEDISKLMLQQGSEYASFAQSCNWPDHIKSDKSKAWLNPHHYINVQANALAVTDQDCGQKGCVTQAIRDNLAVFQHSQSPQKRLEAVMFVGHFVGDIHQPLHVSYAVDRGGNLYPFKFGSVKTNLHAVWDFHLLNYRFNKYDKTYSIAKQVSEKNINTDCITQQKSVDEILCWANESYFLTKQIYSDLDQFQIMNKRYFERYNDIAFERVKLAGHRLAHILNAIHSPEQN